MEGGRIQQQGMGWDAIGWNGTVTGPDGMGWDGIPSKSSGLEWNLHGSARLCSGFFKLSGDLQCKMTLNLNFSCIGISLPLQEPKLF